MTHCMRIHETGGPEALRWEQVTLPSPAPGEVRVRHAAIGVNFIETYLRRGLYSMPLPSGLGTEAAGVVEEVGEGVEGLHAGDRVAYATGPVGAYCEARNMPASVLVKLPPEIEDRTAAAIMLKGMTVWYLLNRTRQAHGGETVLLHAAAGGVGLLFCQWARSMDVTVIGTVGSDEKAELARQHGCAHTINYRRENVAARVRELTDGAGVPVVYDSVGKDTFNASLDCLSTRGLMVLFGMSSGPVPPLDLRHLAEKGSLYLTRPTLRHYVARREELEEGARELFGKVSSGKLRTRIDRTIPLQEAAEAHRALEARATSGQVLLIP
jgi:NADPH2:quinone reductase